MVSRLAVITIDINPNVHVGPLSLTWHGIMIALGLALGVLVATRYGRRLGLDPERVTNAALLLVLGGVVGSRFLYLALNTPTALIRPSDWIGGNGYAIYGGLVVGVLAAAGYLRRHRLGLRYMDALAFGFPFGLAVGRIGCLINGEHYGPASTLPWAIRHPNPAARVPDHLLAYHDGGFYELVLGLLLIAVVMALRNRLRSPGSLLWLVVGLYGAGRFLTFFYRSDSHAFGLGLNYAQLISAALMLAAVLGAWLSGRGATTPPTTPGAVRSPVG